jgi:DNA invertase Pin-like site-specific DNA recombinase
MKGYFAYTRVSTVKQGERGSSLAEQRSAIEAYAHRHSLPITAWFQEMETAAKQGRRQFTRMLAELERGRATGVIIHKIDRSARNLKDWAQLGDLMDAGVEVHFAHESLDLSSRGGRLSADIQAVVAADYIRNLRQEVIKGFYGRLKQGFYPLPAPRGYLDRGKAQPKAIDPVVGPLVREAFDLYASGSFSLDSLRLEMARRGLRGRTGKPLSLDAVATMLKNPFYSGLIRIDRTGEVFQGVHEPIVRKSVFDQVQAVMHGRGYARPQKHPHTYRRLIRCKACGCALTGEVQKGRTYYRCHSKACRGAALREDRLEAAIFEFLALLSFSDDEMQALRELARQVQEDDGERKEVRKAELLRRLGNCDDRLVRLTDALLDGVVDKALFDARKAALLSERSSINEALKDDDTAEPVVDRAMKLFELANTAYLCFRSALPEEKRAILKEATSNLVAHKKSLEIQARPELQPIVEWRLRECGGPSPGALRTSTNGTALREGNPVTEIPILWEAELAACATAKVT